MAWSDANATAGIGGTGNTRWRQGRLRVRTLARRAGRRLRRVAAVVTASSLVGSGLVPVAVVAGGAVAATAASIVAAHDPAKASVSGSVLILSTSVNGGASSAEAQAATALGLSVTVATPTTWDAMTQSQFAGYNAIIIGDPSTSSSCATSVPSDAQSTTGTWGPAINGNVALLGTAPALGGATTLISDAIAYAASGGSGKTGLYASLNCEYSTASAGTSVPLLASVEGGGFTVTGQGSNCPSAAGTVNTWEALTLAQFNGLTSGKLGPWSSPACSVEETFNAWPSGLAGLAYYTGASPATYVASDGSTGQAYILAGTPVSSATAALAPSTGGQVPAGATTGGGANPAAPGVSQATAADPVNTENGDFTEPATDLSIPTFGPSLDFSRSYDARVAQQQTQTGTPGALGYGWTDNWATSLSAGRTTPGSIYTIAGLGTGGDGGPALAGSLLWPADIASDAQGGLFVADDFDNRIQEIAASSHSQFGIAMTAGDVYTVAGHANGQVGISGDGGLATQAFLDQPYGVALDRSGNLYIADSLNNRIQKVSAATGDISTIAGNANGKAGNSGNGGLATKALLDNPLSVTVDAGGDLFIGGYGTNQVYEVPASSGNGMTAGNIYTIAGSTSQASGYSGDGGPATSALLNGPRAVAVDASGNVYISDSLNNRVQEIAASTHSQWGQGMTKGYIYTVAGSSHGAYGNSGDGAPATSATLDNNGQIVIDSAGDLYIADSYNNRVREVAAANGVQWGQAMTSGDIYDVAGSSAGTYGLSGDGGRATSALEESPEGVAADATGDLFITESDDNRLREVTAASTPVFGDSPAASGLTVNQADGPQVTFYPQSGGQCATPYVLAGQYCTLPQNIGASLTYNSGNGIYTFIPQPGTKYTYNTGGNLTSVTDAAGNTVSADYGTPLPGSGHCPSAASWCQTITAANGRALTIGYNAASEVTSVTDPMGRQWGYAYNSSGDLASVTDPMSHVTSYTYGAGSTGNPLNANNLLTISKPNAQPGAPDAGDATVNVYDASGRVTSQTDPMGYKTTFDYSQMNASTGNGAVTVSDPDGNKTVYDYSQGTLAAQSAWTGTTLTSEQDYIPDQTATASDPSAGTQLNIATADGNGNVTAYTYDANGNLVSTTAPDGVGTQLVTTTQQYTGLNLAACSSDAIATSTCPASPGPSPVSPGGVITPPPSIPPQGITWTLYDTDGNLLYTTTGVYQPGGSTASYSRTTYQLFKSNSVSLNGTTISCNAAPPSPSLPCASINADGVVTQLAYNSAGDLTSSATPDGNGSELATTTFSFDNDGEQISTTSPDGNLNGANGANYITTTGWNNDGQKTSVTQAGGTGATVTPRTTTYGYDPNGNQTTVKNPRDYTTMTTYNADDRRTMVTDPDGNQQLICFDAAGHVTQTVPAVGVAAGSLTPASCPTAYPSGYGQRLAADATTYTFDASGNQTAITTPAPSGQSGYETSTYAFDHDGNVLTSNAPPATGSTNQVTVDTYNSAGELSSQTTGYGTSAASTTSYCYGPSGDRTAVVWPDGNTSGTAACETASPWVVSSSSYPTQAAYQTTSSYDSVGELVSTTSPATSAAPNGATTTYTYDPVRNKLTSTDPNGVTTTWKYTPLNLPSSVTYSGSTAHSVSYGYDADGNKTSMSDATGSSAYAWDPFGELTSARNGAGQVTGYGYNPDGLVTSITYPLPATAAWATSGNVTYGYDNADLPTSVTDFNGNKITITNSADGPPTLMSLGSTGDQIAVTYSQTDMPSAITLKNASTTLLGFSYTDAPAGNVTAEADTPSSPTWPANYTYDAQDRVTSMTPGTNSRLSYGFDASSNLTSLPTGAAGTYDHGGELTSLVLSGTTTSYAYNTDGERLSAKQGSTTIAAGSWNGAGELTSYVSGTADMTAASYDGTGLRATVTTGSGSQGFVWNTVRPVPRLIMDSSNAYVYGLGDAPVEQVSLSNGTVRYLVADALGSIRGIVNSSGNLAASTAYDAWGNPETTGGLTSSTPFGFAGAYTDPTGLIYLIHRYYDPANGQFLSVDPDIRQTQQPYAYAGGNPVTKTDPSGLDEIWGNCGYSYLYMRNAYHGDCLFRYGFGSDRGSVVYRHLQNGWSNWTRGNWGYTPLDAEWMWSSTYNTSRTVYTRSGYVSGVLYGYVEVWWGLFCYIEWPTSHADVTW